MYIFPKLTTGPTSEKGSELWNNDRVDNVNVGADYQIEFLPWDKDVTQAHLQKE